MSLTCPNCGAEHPKSANFCSSCAHPLASFALTGGTILERRYRIISALAAGAMGAIYRAEDMRLGASPCAVKEMILDNFPKSDRNDAITRFEREAYLLAVLRHPGLPTARDRFEHQGRHYLVMDLIEGESLQDLLEKTGRPMEYDEVLRIGMELLEILQFLHDQSPSVIFRDVKPSNLIRRAHDGKIILVDFGIARAFAPGKKSTQVGTPGFAPKEQYLGKTEPRSDIYAAGMTILALLTGREPEPFVRWKPSDIGQAVPPDLEKILEKATEEDLPRRWKTARDMKEALEGLARNPAASKLQGARACTRKALEHLKRHQISDAIAECSKALLIQPDFMEAHLYLGHAYLKEGRLHAAVEKYEKARALEPNDTRIHCNMGLALRQMGRTGDALDATRKALALDPKNVVAYNNLGSIYRDVGKLQEAAEAYQEALKIDPDYMAAHYNLGLIHYDMGKVEESMKETRHALAADPRNPFAHINLGLAYFSLGRVKESIECYEKALMFDPENAQAHNNLGVVHHSQGRLEDALFSFRKALECDPHLTFARINISMIEQELKNEP